jgi:HAD superfamily hydrolase (TIGR01662 family)
MSLTPNARKRLDAAAELAIASQKSAWIDKLRRLQAVVLPPLRNSELSLGLGLEAPMLGQQGASAVGRFLSTAPRNRAARPDTRTRVLIDLILDGELFLAVEEPSIPGARRQVLVLEAEDVVRLGRSWTVKNLAGRPVPPRDAEDWEAGWDLFEPEPMAASAGGLPRALASLELPALGLGCMRLSTEGRPDRGEAVALIHAALDGGLRLLDTADSYALDETESGHNEALIAEALASWSGHRERVVVATKVGLVRPGGRWIPDTRPEHIRAACEASLARLGRLDLVQLHVPGPHFEDSLGELVRLREEGKLAHIGLCNVDLAELDRALERTDIASVQCAASPWEPGPFRSGLVQRCAERGLAFIAHSPLGGHRSRGDDPVLGELAAAAGLSQAQLVLAWLQGMGAHVLGIPGATKPSSLSASLRVLGLPLEPSILEAIDARLGWSRQARADIAQAQPAPEPQVRIVMGAPASGKSSAVQPWVDRGWSRLNRDELGGALADLLAPLEEALGRGEAVVMDNTYPSREARRQVIEVASARQLPVHAVWLQTPVEEALYNAAQRMIERCGRLLSPEEIVQASRGDPNLFPPQAVFRYQQLLELPSLDEGFASLQPQAFQRRRTGTRRGLIVDLDGTVRTSRGPAPFPLKPSDVEILPGRKALLHRLVGEGVVVVAVTNQAGVSMGQLSEADVVACNRRTAEELELDLDIRYCPHPAGAIRCWCRKPMPGLGVALIREHDLDREQTTMVGDQDSDRAFAQNLGVAFAEAEDFFG